MRKYFFFLLMFFCLSLNVKAQSISSSHPLQIDVDIARFYGDDTLVYVELYYSLRERNFTFQQGDNKYVAGVNMTADIMRNDTMIVQKSWSVPYVIADTASLTQHRTVVGEIAFSLKEGEYVLKIVSVDIFDTTRVNRLVLPLHIESFASETILSSDIELCSSIQSSTNTNGMFYKNTLEVIPNPSRLYGDGVPFVFYYLEIYNLLKQQRRDDIVVRATVINAVGKEVHREQARKSRVYDSAVEIGKVNTASLRAGTYLLTISILDTTENLLSSVSKKFFVYKSLTENDVAAGGYSAFSPEYLIMNEEQLDLEFDQAHYIATEAERKQYALLNDVDAKRKFLSDFWKRRDTNPETPENEFRIRYMERIEVAKREFSGSLHVGWKTDRGRVHILYGRADEVERFPNTSESNPYEIWRYNDIQGGVIFVFVDRNGFGDYVLVHSTHREELHNTNWFQEYAQKMH